jgi:hypothetical protein
LTVGDSKPQRKELEGTFEWEKINEAQGRGPDPTKPEAAQQPRNSRGWQEEGDSGLDMWHVQWRNWRVLQVNFSQVTNHHEKTEFFFAKSIRWHLVPGSPPGDFYGHPQDEHLPVGLLRGRIRIREYSNEEWCSRSHLCMSRRRWGVSWCFMLSSVRDLIMVGGLWHPWIGNPHVNLPRKVWGFFDQLNHDFRWTMRVKLQAFKSHCLHGIKSKIQEWKPPTSPALWPINA